MDIRALAEKILLQTPESGDSDYHWALDRSGKKPGFYTRKVEELRRGSLPSFMSDLQKSFSDQDMASLQTNLYEVARENGFNVIIDNPEGKAPRVFVSKSDFETKLRPLLPVAAPVADDDPDKKFVEETKRRIDALFVKRTP